MPLYLKSITMIAPIIFRSQSLLFLIYIYIYKYILKLHCIHFEINYLEFFKFISINLCPSNLHTSFMGPCVAILYISRISRYTNLNAILNPNHSEKSNYSG